MSKVKIAKTAINNNSLLGRICEQYPNEEFIRIDGFDAAIIGVNADTMQLIYSIKQTIQILIEQLPEDNNEDEDMHTMAIEYFENNIRDVKGHKFPIWCEDIFL